MLEDIEGCQSRSADIQGAVEVRWRVQKSTKGVGRMLPRGDTLSLKVSRGVKVSWTTLRCGVIVSWKVLKGAKVKLIVPMDVKVI